MLWGAAGVVGVVEGVVLLLSALIFGNRSRCGGDMARMPGDVWGPHMYTLLWGLVIDVCPEGTRIGKIWLSIVQHHICTTTTSGGRAPAVKAGCGGREEERASGELWDGLPIHCGVIWVKDVVVGEVG